MKLYYAPGACSLSPHIVAREAGITLDLDKLDFHTGKTASGKVLRSINPKGVVPTLELDDGTILTEGPAIIQYLADQKPASGLLPPLGSLARYRVIEWISYLHMEVHPLFVPLFRPGTAEDAKRAARDSVLARLEFIDQRLAGQNYVANGSFSIADAYTFVILNWTHFVRIDLAPYPNIRAYMAGIAQRPKVQEALQVEGLM